MSSNPEEQPPSYEEAMGSSPSDAPASLSTEQPGSSEATASATPENPPQEDAEERKKKKAEEAGWRSDLLQPTNGPREGNAIPTPGSSSQEEGQDSACGVSSNSQSLEERNRLKAEEAGWKGNVLMPAAGPSSVSGPGMLPSPPLVLPPGLQPLIMLDILFLRGNYGRGKGRRYKVTNKNGGAILYARSVRKGHHRPKDFQLYDSTRTAVVGQLTFTQAADDSMYANLECPSRVSLATIRAENYLEQSNTMDPSQSAVSHVGVKYTICNALGQPVFVIPAPPVTNSPGVQIKVYSSVSPDTSVADILWDLDEEAEGADELESAFGDKDDSSDERRVKITFPLDLEVKMKAAIVAMCLLKDKIDHRMAKGSAHASDVYRGPINDALGIAFGHRRRRRHHRF